MGPEEAAVAAELWAPGASSPRTTAPSPCSPGHPTRCGRCSPPVPSWSHPRRGRPSRWKERWFGSTGRRVPAIALEGTIDIQGALEIAVDDGETLRAAHAVGTPVVVRAATAAEVARALARPEVSCVLVSDPALLELDLAEITYG